MRPVTDEPDLGVPERRFLPDDFDPADADAIRAQVETLCDRPLPSAEALAQWLEEWSELESAIDGAVARRYIAMTRDTRDESARRAYLDYEREIVPLWRTLDDRLNRRYLDCPYREALGERYVVFDRQRARAAEIFREENTRLKARDAELAARYDELQGAITVEIDGETLTAQQCSARLEDLSRDVRRRAFETLAERRLQDGEVIEDVFDQLLLIRGHVAENAGFASFRDYRFAELCRFDYGPADCEAFHSAVETIVVPVLRDLAERRKQALGLESLRYYDLLVGTSGRPPVRPFADESGYIRLARQLFAAVDERFANDFDVLVRNELLDLMSRPGKAPGGYNYPLEDVRVPFIFFNAVGRHDDVQTILHEGGHAFHTLATRDEPLQSYRAAPIEFCEVASMAMELFGLERLSEVYDSDDVREVTRSHLEGILESFSWFATIDAFQHWLYTHPGHSIAERHDAWVAIYDRFVPHVDWSGYEPYRDTFWQKQGHLFGSPFYYIEYAIAQIGALQAWLLERQDHEAAVAGYRRALALGGSRPLPELFETAGLRFAMDESVLAELVPAIVTRIDELR